MGDKIIKIRLVFEDLFYTVCHLLSKEVLLGEGGPED